MVVEIGEKIHIMTRRRFEQDMRRHFVGSVLTSDGSIVRMEGYTFVFDPHKDNYDKRPEKRIRIIDLSGSGHIVNIIPKETVLEKVIYNISDRRLVVTDEKTFSLDINEFGPMR